MDVTQRLARRLKSLREERGWSLDALALRSGVSRSNISLIERGQSSPTASVLDKLSAGLGVTLASLFEEPAAAGAAASPGTSNCNRANAFGFTVKLELATPVTAGADPELAVMVVASALRKIVVNVVVDWPAEKFTAVV